MHDFALKIVSGLLVAIVSLVAVLWNAQQGTIAELEVRVTMVENQILAHRAARLERERLSGGR